MEITINQQTIRYQDTRKTLQLRTQKKTENTVDKIMAKVKLAIKELTKEAMDMVTSNQLGKITNAQFEELQTQITQIILKNEIQEILQEGELHEYNTCRTSPTEVAVKHQVTGTLQDAVTRTKDFESAKSEANHAQAVNLNSGTRATQNSNSQNYLSLLVTPEDITTNNSGSNQQQALINNIPPATVTNDELLAAIFPFDLKETIEILLFSGAALEEKPITAMYTDAKIDGHTIKLILDSGSASSIITRQLMDQLGH
ncbi:hypothetical protein G9A89_023600 [Geosiphon pyriformis]|nr:hypothetical protein G9A89_023600 [Geosiphon pyriformis]